MELRHSLGTKPLREYIFVRDRREQDGKRELKNRILFYIKNYFDNLLVVLGHALEMEPFRQWMFAAKVLPLLHSHAFRDLSHPISAIVEEYHCVIF